MKTGDDGAIVMPNDLRVNDLMLSRVIAFTHR